MASGMGPPRCACFSPVSLALRMLPDLGVQLLGFSKLVFEHGKEEVDLWGQGGIRGSPVAGIWA